MTGRIMIVCLAAGLVLMLSPRLASNTGMNTGQALALELDMEAIAKVDRELKREADASGRELEKWRAKNAGLRALAKKRKAELDAAVAKAEARADAAEARAVASEARADATEALHKALKEFRASTRR